MSILFPLAQVGLAVFIVLCFADLVILFPRARQIEAKRIVPAIVSNGHEQQVEIIVLNKSVFLLKARIIDEIPYQFQIRDLKIPVTLPAQKKIKVNYSLDPVERGDYQFGNLLFFLTSRFQLLERKLEVDAAQNVCVYPSILEMKKYELSTFAKVSQIEGIKKVRKIGHSQEFDHIREYVLGDDPQSINWNATSRATKLMVNHYEDEKSQQVYCLIDKSRVMKLPFNGMSLLEYAINSALVISNTILKKHDRAGVITFSNKIDRLLKAGRTKSQLRRILDLLYNEKTNFGESNFELLYHSINSNIQIRSLLFLFTNFESDYALQRNIAILRKLNKKHLLVVIFFENSEIVDYSEEKAQNLEEIYNRTIAKKLIYEKLLIANKLKQHGIQTIMTKPEELSINVINKYLELKGKGLI